MMNGPTVPIIHDMRRSTDESGVILDWFLKVGLVLAAIGVVLFDFGSIAVNNFTLSSAAEDVAVAVSITVSDSPRLATSFADLEIYNMAVEEVDDEANGATSARVMKKGTHIDDEGIVHVRLRRKAKTLVTHWIGPLKNRTIAVVDGQAGTN